MPAPVIDERTDMWLYAFDLLSSSRPAGFNGPGPIPISEMRALLGMIPLPCANDEFVRVVQSMDNAYLDHVYKRRGK